VPTPAGNFAYVQTVGADSRVHITPVQIGSAGDFTAKPGLEISFPLLNTINSGCGEGHTPTKVLATTESLFLVVQRWMVCKGADGPEAFYAIYKLDSQTGGIEQAIGGVNVTYPAFPFVAFNGALALRGELFSGSFPPTGDLELVHVGLDGTPVVQKCQSDQPACSHPFGVAFHPSGKWAYISDVIAGGIWTVPITGNSLLPANSLFVPLKLPGGFRFTFAPDGKNLYIAQWGSQSDSGQIVGFHVNQLTGALTSIAGSPWPLGKTLSITTMVYLAGKTE
jgi:hypothetical protein